MSRRVAILGCRGIPANYGGFETLAEELGARLAAGGLDVTVYGRRHHVPAGLTEHRGCRLVAVPTVRAKALDTLVASALQTLHALARGYDAVLMLNAANAPFVLPLRLAGARTLLNVDGIERLRAKWGWLGRLWYRLGEVMAVHFPDVIVADARVIADYYAERYGASSEVIPYGSELPSPQGREVLHRLGLQPDGFLLYVSRFEPENNPHRVVEEYRTWSGIERRRGREPAPLVMLGDAPYQQEWIESWRASAPAGVVFPGAIYGDGYRQLLFGCRAYVQATEVGGTHPALVEALGQGSRVFFNDTPENREVAAGCGVAFAIRQAGDLATALAERLDDEAAWTVLRTAARERCRELYGWDAVSSAYRRLLLVGDC